MKKLNCQKSMGVFSYLVDVTDGDSWEVDLRQGLCRRVYGGHHCRPGEVLSCLVDEHRGNSYRCYHYGQPHVSPERLVRSYVEPTVQAGLFTIFSERHVTSSAWLSRRFTNGAIELLLFPESVLRVLWLEIKPIDRQVLSFIPATKKIRIKEK